jgi:hypothetical protein
MLQIADLRLSGEDDMKVKDAVFFGSLMALVLSGSSVFADPPHKEQWGARKERMEYEREQRKRDREWAREERKRYEELEREERKHQDEMAREARKHQQEMWREGGYTLDEAIYESDVSEASQPAYIEDQLYQIIKEVRDLAEVVNQ